MLSLGRILLSADLLSSAGILAFAVPPQPVPLNSLSTTPAPRSYGARPANETRRMPSLIQTVSRAGGVVRTRELRDIGFGGHAIATAVGSGMLTRPRRGWVALHDADAFLVAAARNGVVLTCITRAKRLGLWVLDIDRPHLAAPSTASRLDVLNARVHWCEPVVPRPPGALEDGIHNTLVIVAACQPYATALAVWESALNKQLVQRDELARLPLTATARRMLEQASPFSDSGLETLFVHRLGWLKVAIRQQIWIAGHRVDLLIGERLVVQIDGAHHVGAQRAEDIAHDAALRLLGYHVIRVAYAQVVDGWPAVQDLIMRAVAQGLHRA